MKVKGRKPVLSQQISSVKENKNQTNQECNGHHDHFHDFQEIKEWTLHKFEDLPKYFQYNPYIVNGYRKHLSSYDCLKSLFRFHNETINVWTHLIGFIYFLWITFETLFLPSNESDTLTTRLVLIIFLISAKVCFLGSSTYHLFNCHSEHVMMKVTRFDYSGINLLISGSFFPPVFFSFYCFPKWQVLYLSAISLIGISGCVFSLFEFYHQPSYNKIRNLVFAGTAASGLVPIIHSTALGSDIFFNTEVIWNIKMLYLLYGSGLFVYIFKIPECFFKGKFDYWFNSHQLWHLFVLGATYVHLQNCKLIYTLWTQSNACPVS